MRVEKVIFRILIESRIRGLTLNRIALSLSSSELSRCLVARGVDGRRSDAAHGASARRRGSAAVDRTHIDLVVIDRISSAVNVVRLARTRQIDLVGRKQRRTRWWWSFQELWPIEVGGPLAALSLARVGGGSARYQYVNDL